MRRLRPPDRVGWHLIALARVGLKREPPRAAARLHEHGATVKASLENPALGLKPLIVIETGDDVAEPHKQLASQLEPELTELGELVGGRHQENRKSADVRSQRRRVIQEFDRDVRAIVRTAQGLFRLAGRDDLAERFRPILRKISRRVDKAKAEEAAERPAEASEPEGEPATPTAETAAPEETTA